MATITNAQLALVHDHRKRTVLATVKANVNFSTLEVCQMKSCSEAKLFKLKCQLWGSDSGLTGADDFLYTYTKVFYFPDPTPAATESVTFTETLGEGVLDEDWGEDEVYGKLKLQNLFTLVEVTKNTNTVHHSF
jgi:hypothetical protein